MKTSIKIILSGFLFICILSSINIVFLCNEIREDDWVVTRDMLAAHDQYSESDSIVTEAPSTLIKWYNITLGPNKSLDYCNRKDSDHIFRDMGLVLDEVYPIPHMNYQVKHTATFKENSWRLFLPIETEKVEMNASDKYTIGSSYFTFITDSLWRPGRQLNFYKRIRIEITKKSYLPENSGLAEKPAIKRNRYFSMYSQESQSGQYNELISRGIAHAKDNTIKVSCSWQKGLWSTRITLYNSIFYGDLEKTIQLRNQIRDRIFEYYRELNRKYADSS